MTWGMGTSGLGMGIPVVSVNVQKIADWGENESAENCRMRKKLHAIFCKESLSCNIAMLHRFVFEACNIATLLQRCNVAETRKRVQQLQRCNTHPVGVLQCCSCNLAMLVATLGWGSAMLQAMLQCCSCRLGSEFAKKCRLLGQWWKLQKRVSLQKIAGSRWVELVGCADGSGEGVWA